MPTIHPTAHDSPDAELADDVSVGAFTVIEGPLKLSAEIAAARGVAIGDMRIFIPAGGSTISCDDLRIPTDARKVDLAHAIINHLTDSRVAAVNMDTIGDPCGKRVLWIAEWNNAKSA